MSLKKAKPEGDRVTVNFNRLCEDMMDVNSVSQELQNELICLYFAWKQLSTQTCLPRLKKAPPPARWVQETHR